MLKLIMHVRGDATLTLNGMVEDAFVLQVLLKLMEFVEDVHLILELAQMDKAAAASGTQYSDREIWFALLAQSTQ